MTLKVQGLVYTSLETPCSSSNPGSASEGTPQVVSVVGHLWLTSEDLVDKGYLKTCAPQAPDPTTPLPSSKLMLKMKRDRIYSP